MLELPEIYFIRHGQTDWNAEGRYQGQRDIPLNAKGQGQADGNGVLLRQLLERDDIDPAKLDWIASPLSRTRETMNRVRSAFDNDLPDITFDERLVEISFGIYEGTLASDHAASGMQKPGARDEAHWNFRPDDGESYVDVAERISAILATLRGPTVIVSHGGVARVFRHLVEGVERKDAVNWATPQDAILNFAGGKLNLLPAG